MHPARKSASSSSSSIVASGALSRWICRPVGGVQGEGAVHGAGASGSSGGGGDEIAAAAAPTAVPGALVAQAHRHLAFAQARAFCCRRSAIAACRLLLRRNRRTNLPPRCPQAPGSTLGCRLWRVWELAQLGEACVASRPRSTAVHWRPQHPHRALMGAHECVEVRGRRQAPPRYRKERASCAGV